MLPRILRRILILVVHLGVIFLLSRALILFLPGDPIQTLVAETGTRVPEEDLLNALGWRDPWWVSAPRDLWKALRGDFGISVISGQPVAPMLRDRTVSSIVLGALGLGLGLGFAIFLGCWAARTPRGKADRFCDFWGAMTAALPTVWIGPILAYVFSMGVTWLPISGHIVLPAVTLAIAFSGLWARLIRNRVRDTLIHGAARAARSRGLAEWKILLKYGLAPASGALVAYLGTQAGHIAAGAVVTETIFDWPGLGHLLIDSVLRRDYPVVIAAIFVGSGLCLAGTAAGDILQAWIDRRMTEKEGAA